MKITGQKVINVAAFVLVIVLAGATGLQAQQNMQTVSDGQKVKVLGLITSRDADSFKLTTLDKSSTYNVALTPETSVKSNTKGIFRAGTRYESSYLLRGLRVEVEGTGNTTGDLVAKSVRFN